jgi:hypothetical protein
VVTASQTQARGQHSQGLTPVMHILFIMAARRGRCTPNPLQHRQLGVDVMRAATREARKDFLSLRSERAAIVPDSLIVKWRKKKSSPDYAELTDCPGR